MREHPIIFSPPMVQAILAGRKTQTRRVIKPQPRIRPEIHEPPDGGEPFWCVFAGDEIAHRVRIPWRVGDVLWVRETLQRYSGGMAEPTVQYAADLTGVPHNGLVPGAPDGRAWWRWKMKKLPSIHMPRWACRISLKVTDVRVERLQQISEQDAIAEGIEPDEHRLAWRCYLPEPKTQDFWQSPASSYRTLWTLLHGAESWDANPWVTVISFEPVRIGDSRCYSSGKAVPEKAHEGALA